jgi:hypothetical protein
VLRFERIDISSGYIFNCKHPLQFQGGLTSGRRSVVKINAESLSQYDEKHVVPTPLSGIRVGRRRRRHTTHALSPKE